MVYSMGRRQISRVSWQICALLFVAAAGCTKFDLLNATIPPCGYSRTADVAYGPSRRQKLDIYCPTHPDPDGRAVIFFYGGDWQTGSKEDYRFVAQALASQGFVAVLPDYRLYPSATFPAFMGDGAMAVRWAYDNVARFGGDPRHLYLMGHSAGAYIAALLSLDPRYLSAVGLSRDAIRATAALSGPYDFIPSLEDLPVFGMKPGDRPVPGMEPIDFVDGHEPPMLLIHGLKDQTVDAINAARLTARICQAGGKVRYIAYPERAHVGVVLSLAAPFRWLAPTLRDVSTFFREH
jgi:acetyl esterase/lipase